MTFLPLLLLLPFFFFLLLPSPPPHFVSHLQEYYQLIDEPMSLSAIQFRLRARRYSSLSQLVDDFKLVFRNARVFNEPGSNVLKTAAVLEKAFIAELRKVWFAMVALLRQLVLFLFCWVLFWWVWSYHRSSSVDRVTRH